MTPGPEDDVSQSEKRRIVREQSRNGDTGTFLSHTHVDEISGGGRFAAVSPATVIGQDPAVKYPQLPSSSPWSDSDPVPDEPPLGYEINKLNPHELEPSLNPAESAAPGFRADSPARQTGEPAPGAAPSPSPLADVERAGVGSPLSPTKESGNG
jgi:hypothetical protein